MKEPSPQDEGRKENKNSVYIGTKIIKARPMTSDEFKKSKGDNTENEENAHGYRVEYEDGYVSWSPKAVFERCYRLLSESEVILLNSL